MKKFLSLAVLVCATSVVVNAQYFVGGSFNFSTTGGSTKTGAVTTDKDRTTQFSLNPMFGKYISNDLMAGIELGFSSSRSTNPNTDVTTTSTGFGLAPFARYYAFRFNKFSVFGQGQLGIGFNTTKYKSNTTTVDGPKTTSVSLTAFPGLAYELSSKFELQTTINVFNFGYSYSSSKEGSGNTETRDRTSTFGFGAGLDNIVKLGDISVGAIYKF